MESMRSWKDLGVVDTIYEEEHNEDASSSSSSSSSAAAASLSSSPLSLHSRVVAWSKATGVEPEVVIHVQKLCFHLHKSPLATRSGSLRRQLTKLTEITLSPPLKITAETFTLVAGFCYGADLVLTSFNIAALRIAAGLLEMTGNNGDNLLQKTEVYFRRVVAVNREYASIVFHSCLSLLPEAETEACLVSRCIEALSLMDSSNDVMSRINDVKTVRAEDFLLIVESLHRTFTRSHEVHDVIYKTVDFYLQENGGKITEEQKSRMCGHIDCGNLSPPVLMHAVQNPIMPLRFVIQAMFVEQLNTRRSIFSAANDVYCRNHPHGSQNNNNKDVPTLGAILQRDAAIRQVAQLKAAMDATSARIQSLEKNLSGMRRVLKESDGLRSSSSFRLSSENRIHREQRGSASFHVASERGEVEGSPSSEESWNGSRTPKKFGRRLISGLKSALRVANKKSSESRASNQVREDEDKNENE